MATVVFQAQRLIPAPPEVVWPLVSDLEGFGHVAPNLSRVEILTGHGEGLVRRCFDTQGRGWTETCTLWEEGRRYAMRVDTSTYPLALRMSFRTFEGVWEVEPVHEGSRVTMTFTAEPRMGAVGALLARAGRRSAEATMAEILDRWHVAATEAADAQGVEMAPAAQ